MPEIEIRALNASPDIREALSEILVETVANGGSVSFMHPLAVEVAHTFWSGSLAAGAPGERVVVGALGDESLIRKVNPLLECAPYPPHRGPVGKVLIPISSLG